MSNDIGTNQEPVRHVGDTRFEGWLSCHEPDRNQNRTPRYSKQDMRKAYWAGYCEASDAPAAPVAQEPCRFPGCQFTGCPDSGCYASAPAAPVAQPLTDAASDVLAERRRQVEVDGWTPEHDDAEHVPGELALAACCYCVADEDDAPPAVWPWAWAWWKPKDRRRNMVKAAALLLAEIERLDRAVGHEGGAA